jgi:hypothetical protein
VVTIADEAVAQLETENANVAKGITPAEVKRLPQPGRDPYELIRLTPGIFGDGSRSANGNSSVCRILRAQAAPIIRFSRRKTSHKLVPTDNASPLTTFRSMVSASIV